MTPPDEHLTPDEIAELGALLVAERPQPSERFAAELDARVARRFAPATSATAEGSRWRAWRGALRRPLLPAAAATVAAGLAAVVIAVGGGGDPRIDGASAPPSTGSGAASFGSAPPEAQAQLSPEKRALSRDSAAAGPGDTTSFRALKPVPGAFDDQLAGTRKVERSASLELGADADRVDDVAKGVLGVVARYDGIVDQSTVTSGEAGDAAQFALRIPAARLADALAALSRLPDAHVVSRSDDALDVNRQYVSIRRQLANARAERTGLLRALAAADTEDELLRLRARLDGVEYTIARFERAQRALDRRIDYSRVTVAVRADAGSRDGGAFTVDRAFHDAGRVLEVALGVVVIAAAALLPLALLAAVLLPLARALARRRREQALDAAV